MADRHVKMTNWERWQTYRKDRGNPPWIKVHRILLRNYEWLQLSDAQRGQLVSMWLLAADKDGAIPASASALQKICGMDAEPDLQLFASLGFIEADATVTPEWRQHDATVTPQSRVVQSRVELEQEGGNAHASLVPLTDLPEAKYIRVTEEQVQHLTALAESTGISIDEAAAKRGYRALTKLTASILIDDLRKMRDSKPARETFAAARGRKTDEAFAEILRGEDSNGRLESGYDGRIETGGQDAGR